MTTEFSNDRYRKGGFWRIDDRSGERVRNYNTKREWNGAIVNKEDWETRQPQDFVRGVPDVQTVPNPRPVELIPNYVGPLTTQITATSAAGATMLTVDSTVRFSPGDTIAIMLDSTDRFMAVVDAIVNSTQLTIRTALPWSTSSGNNVIDYSAVSPASF